MSTRGCYVRRGDFYFCLVNGWTLQRPRPICRAAAEIVCEENPGSTIEEDGAVEVLRPGLTTACMAPGCRFPFEAHLSGFTSCPFVPYGAPPLAPLVVKMKRVEA